MRQPERLESEQKSGAIPVDLLFSTGLAGKSILTYRRQACILPLIAGSKKILSNSSR
jgi:hypothetical protein